VRAFFFGLVLAARVNNSSSCKACWVDFELILYESTVVNEDGVVQTRLNKIPFFGLSNNHLKMTFLLTFTWRWEWRLTGLKASMLIFFTKFCPKVLFPTKTYLQVTNILDAIT